MKLKYCGCLLLLLVCACNSQRNLSRRFMDNAIRYEWNVDTARLSVNLLEPRTPQLRSVLEDYVQELKALPEYDKRLKPKIYVSFEVLNADTVMRIYMDHSVSMVGLESFVRDTSQSPFCGVFYKDELDVSILRSELENPCFDNLFQNVEGARTVDYAYDFNVKNGKVRMVNNFYWSYTKRYLVKGDEFVKIEQKYLPIRKSNVRPATR